MCKKARRVIWCRVVDINVTHDTGDKRMTERNYALKKLMRNALLEVLGSGMSFSFVELREEIRRRYSDICIDDRKIQHASLSHQKRYARNQTGK